MLIIVVFMLKDNEFKMVVNNHKGESDHQINNLVLHAFRT